LCLSADDRALATGSCDTTVRLWHVASGQELAILKAHHGQVHSVAFSPDGNLLVSGGEMNGDRGEVFL
jgi:WD40 repeat protein